MIIKAIRRNNAYSFRIFYRDYNRKPTKEIDVKQFGRNVRYIYKMRRLGYPYIGIYRGWNW